MFHYTLPIEGRDEWLAAARRQAGLTRSTSANSSGGTACRRHWSPDRPARPHRKLEIFVPGSEDQQMSTQTYRDQVTRLVSELGSLETKLARAREEAARERSAAGRAINSISRSTSASTVQSRLREAERHEARAVTQDKEAARIANLIASKQKARSDAGRHLADAEAADRKKLALEADRRRRDDSRHIADLERARRATQARTSILPFAGAAFRVPTLGAVEAKSAYRHRPALGPGRPPWTAEQFWARYRDACARATPPYTHSSVAPEFELLDGTRGTDPEYLRKLVRKHGRPPD